MQGQTIWTSGFLLLVETRTFADFYSHFSALQLLQVATTQPRAIDFAKETAKIRNLAHLQQVTMIDLHLNLHLNLH